MLCRPALMLLALLPLLALSAPTEDKIWEEYKAKYNKHYTNKAEEEKRYNLFKARVQKVAEHNDNLSRGKISYTLAINDFADKTEEELQSMLGVVIPEGLPQPTAGVPRPTAGLPQPTTGLPQPTTGLPQPTAGLPQPEEAVRQNLPSVDLRNDPCMPPVKSQKGCGSCWAFAAVNLMEYAYCKKNNLQSPAILSEQNLVDCTYNRDGCKGGFYSTAWSNVSNIVSASNYPYTSGDTKTWNNGTCSYNPAAQVTHVSDYDYLPNEAEIEAALSKLAPVAVAIKVLGDNFYQYKSGIYSDTVSCAPSVINKTVNHAVTLVGYNNLNNPPYWILRNSWNTTWGMNGYMYMQKGINLCNVGLFGYGNVVVQ